MYKLYDFKNIWVLIIEGDIIRRVLKDQTWSRWKVGEEYYADEFDSLIAESGNLKELIEIGMLYVL